MFTGCKLARESRNVQTCPPEGTIGLFYSYWSILMQKKFFIIIYCPTVLFVSIFMQKKYLFIAQLFYSYHYLWKEVPLLLPSCSTRISIYAKEVPILLTSSPTRISIYAKEVSFFLLPTCSIRINVYAQEVSFFSFFFLLPWVRAPKGKSISVRFWQTWSGPWRVLHFRHSCRLCAWNDRLISTDWQHLLLCSGDFQTAIPVTNRTRIGWNCCAYSVFRSCCEVGDDSSFGFALNVHGS